ncbi:hypothetical protein P7K49_026908 [Saguinus oedipus]|uniref:Uncharacterized protein n=1 Tax=Saguinus oedipus TaxID=9490 RepID=A0ABQ9UEK0_SAGOE|nr:hypothetical protein P7K49_026908 [Saguinus oedipus]
MMDLTENQQLPEQQLSSIQFEHLTRLVLSLNESLCPAVPTPESFCLKGIYFLSSPIFSKTHEKNAACIVEFCCLAHDVFSLATSSPEENCPHTGIQEYQDGVPKIPTACITVEDAEMMSRMAARGIKIVIQLKMAAKTYPDTDSFNTVAEITGSKYPEQD